MATRVELYLAHLDRLSGGIAPRFHRVPSTHEGQHPITAIVYIGLPEPGFITGITYGLSLADHPDWRLAKPELLISVRSADVRWALAVATFAEEWRGEQPFAYGTTLNHREPICSESSMSAFVIFAPAVLEREDCQIDVGEARNVNLNGCYPIYESERNFIHEKGLEPFWNLEWDPYDVRRAPVV